MLKRRSALVVGSTGLVGTHLIELLCESEQYVSVTALTRNELYYEHSKLTVRQVDFDELTERDFDIVDDVFCCLGTTRKKAGSREVFEKVDVEYPLRVASIAKKMGVAHFIVISAMGASEKSVAYYNRVKGKLEAELVSLSLPHVSIVRPSLLVGKRREFRFGEKLGEMVLAVLNPLLVGPLKKYRSIEARQVALAMMMIALEESKERVRIFHSGQLASYRAIEKEKIVEEEISREQMFNWEKFKEEMPPVDEEVVFRKKD